MIRLGVFAGAKIAARGLFKMLGESMGCFVGNFLPLPEVLRGATEPRFVGPAECRNIR